MHRLKLKEEETCKETHTDLNEQAAENIISANIGQEQCEKDFIEQLENIGEEKLNDALMAPLLQKAASRY